MPSDSTESWDRAGKFRRYRRLATLRDDVLVSQHERRIEVYSRRADGVWELREAGEDESVPLSAFGASIEVDRVYRGVTLDPVAPAGLSLDFAHAARANAPEVQTSIVNARRRRWLRARLRQHGRCRNTPKPHAAHALLRQRRMHPIAPSAWCRRSFTLHVPRAPSCAALALLLGACGSGAGGGPPGAIDGSTDHAARDAIAPDDASTADAAPISDSASAADALAAVDAAPVADDTPPRDAAIPADAAFVRGVLTAPSTAARLCLDGVAISTDLLTATSGAERPATDLFALTPGMHAVAIDTQTGPAPCPAHPAYSRTFLAEPGVTYTAFAQGNQDPPRVVGDPGAPADAFVRLRAWSASINPRSSVTELCTSGSTPLFGGLERTRPQQVDVPVDAANGWQLRRDGIVTCRDTLIGQLPWPVASGRAYSLFVVSYTTTPNTLIVWCEEPGPNAPRASVRCAHQRF